MELKLIKSFICVAQTLSFSDAAQMLNYSQPTVSEQIKKLEEDLDTVLFERLGRKLKLTTEGTVFLDYSKQIIALCDKSISHLDALKNESIRGDLNIAMTESMCFYKLPNMLKTFYSNYPQVNLNIKIGNCYDFPTWIAQNLIDIAFVLDDEFKYNNIISTKMSLEELVLFASKDYLDGNHSKFTIEDLKSETLILTQPKSKYRNMIKEYLSNLNIEAKSELEFESVEAIKSFVRSGLGIGFLPKETLVNDLTTGQVVELPTFDKRFTISAQYLIHSDKWVSPALNALINTVDDYFQISSK